ncbi:hypothetical protein E2562_018036, partial [Oryza meyeriana var. granulata]
QVVDRSKKMDEVLSYHAPQLTQLRQLQIAKDCLEKSSKEREEWPKDSVNKLRDENWVQTGTIRALETNLNNQSLEIEHLKKELKELEKAKSKVDTEYA